MTINYKKESEKYKLALANDLVVCLCKVLIFHMNKAQASELIGKILNNWSERLDRHQKEITQSTTEKFKELTVFEDPEDVISILVDVHTLLPTLIKDEYIGEILEIIQEKVIETVKS